MNYHPKMVQRASKMAQPASKVSPGGPKWAHLEPLLHTLEALLVPLRIFFTHFCEVLVKNCAFSLKINENPGNITQAALKFMNIAQEHRKVLKSA